VTIFAPDSNVL
jgi:hypothetical protein